MEGNQRQFRDLLQRLAELPKLGRLESLIEKSRHQDLSRAEKQEMASLLARRNSSGPELSKAD
jgi:hypothetical protein